MKRIKDYSISVLLVALLLFSCKEHNKKENGITERQLDGETSFKELLPAVNFDTIVDGKPVKLYWLHNKDLTLAITNRG